MPQQAAEMGDGKIWAILNARQALDKPAVEGLEDCLQHTERAADIYRSESGPGRQPTQTKTCEQFASITGQVITDWRDGGQLPVVHPDLTADINSRATTRGDKRFFFHNFNPEATNLSTAAHRLRVVRLALPEILRGVSPDQSDVDVPVREIASHLAKVCMPGQFYRRPSQSSHKRYSWY